MIEIILILVGLGLILAMCTLVLIYHVGKQWKKYDWL